MKSFRHLFAKLIAAFAVALLCVQTNSREASAQPFSHLGSQRSTSAPLPTLQVGTPVYYGLPTQRAPDPAAAIKPTQDWAVRSVDPGSKVYRLTYHIVESVSKPISFTIEYTPAATRHDAVCLSDEVYVDRDADPRNAIYGNQRDQIPRIVLFVQRMIREILIKYDRAGFRPLEDQLYVVLSDASSGNSRYMWLEYKIYVLYKIVALEELKGVLGHEMFHAMQHGKGYNGLSIVLRTHLWLDESTADYAAFFLLGAAPDVDHVKTDGSYFAMPLLFGEYFNTLEAWRFHEYQGCVFLDYYFKNLPYSPDNFGRWFDFVMSESGVSLHDAKLPKILDAFAQQASGMSLSELYANFVRDHVFLPSDFLKIKDDGSDFILKTEKLTDEVPEVAFPVVRGTALSASAASVSFETADTSSQQIAVHWSPMSDLLFNSNEDHFVVWAKVSSSVRGSGSIERVPASAESPLLVDVSEGETLYLLVCNTEVTDTPDFTSSSLGVTITVRKANADDIKIEKIDSLMNEWAQAHQRIEASQRSVATNPSTIDVEVTGQLTTDSRNVNAEFSRRLRLLVRELKCVPTIEISEEWDSTLEAINPQGMFRATEGGTETITLDQVVSLTAEGPAAIVKRIDRNFHLEQASTEIEISEILPPPTLRGRWTGTLTIREIPMLEGVDLTPADDDDPFAAACTAALLKLNSLKNQPFDTTATFTPAAESTPTREAGTVRLLVRTPDQEGESEPRDMTYRYEGGAVTITYREEAARVVLRGNARWRTVEEGGGAEISGSWQAYGTEGGKEFETMNGVWSWHAPLSSPTSGQSPPTRQPKRTRSLTSNTRR